MFFNQQINIIGLSPKDMEWKLVGGGEFVVIKTRKEEPMAGQQNPDLISTSGFPHYI